MTPSTPTSSSIPTASQHNDKRRYSDASLLSSVHALMPASAMTSRSWIANHTQHKNKSTKAKALPKGIHDTIAMMIRQNRYVDCDLPHDTDDHPGHQATVLTPQRKEEVLDFMPCLFQHLRYPKRELCEVGGDATNSHKRRRLAKELLLWERTAPLATSRTQETTDADSAEQMEASQQGDDDDGMEVDSDSKGGENGGNGSNNEDDDVDSAPEEGTGAASTAAATQQASGVDDADSVNKAGPADAKKNGATTAVKKDEPDQPVHDDADANQPTAGKNESKDGTADSATQPTIAASVPPNVDEEHLRCIRQNTLRRYKKELQTVQEDIASVERVRQGVLRRQVELWGAYQYGLHKISKLSNLADAPDAILPGNLCADPNFASKRASNVSSNPEKLEGGAS